MTDLPQEFGVTLVEVDGHRILVVHPPEGFFVELKLL